MMCTVSTGRLVCCTVCVSFYVVGEGGDLLRQPRCSTWDLSLYFSCVKYLFVCTMHARAIWRRRTARAVPHECASRAPTHALNRYTRQVTGLARHASTWGGRTRRARAHVTCRKPQQAPAPPPRAPAAGVRQRAPPPRAPAIDRLCTHTAPSLSATPARAPRAQYCRAPPPPGGARVPGGTTTTSPSEKSEPATSISPSESVD